MQKKVLGLIFMVFCCFFGSLQAEEVKTRQERIEELERRRRVFSFKERNLSREAHRLLTIDWLAYRKHIQKRQWYRKEIEEIDKELEELKEE